MRRLGLSAARQFIDWPESLASVQVTPESLSADAVGRLFERVKARHHRVNAAEARAALEWFWIRAELALIVSRLHPKARDRWRNVLSVKARGSALHLDHLRQLQALILSHEPETDAWLRRQLGSLAQRGDA